MMTFSLNNTENISNMGQRTEYLPKWAASEGLYNCDSPSKLSRFVTFVSHFCEMMIGY